MPSIGIVKRVVRDCVPEITAMLLISALLILVFNLSVGGRVVLYPAALSLAVAAVYLFVKILRVARFFVLLELAENAPLEEPGEGPVQESVFEAIGHIHSRYQSEIYRLRTRLDTRNALFSRLVHGMKSSVAVIELAGEKMIGNAAVADIMAENAKLKNSLEQSLNLLRLDAFVNDYVPEQVNLAELVQHTINECKRDFIYAVVYPKLRGGGVVYTDPKWCALIINQLISNAVKYSESGGTITFDIAGADRVQLHIGDAGVGIPPEDLPRIFDMFFTGHNGRLRKDATGIGLFMAKYIAEGLGIQLQVISEVGKGTTATLIFP